MRTLIAAAACAGCLMQGAAHAADSGFYFGVFGGQADYSLKEPTPPPFISVVEPPVASLDPAFVIDYFGGSGRLPFSNGVLSPPPLFGGAAFAPLNWLTLDNSDDATAWGVTAGYRIMRYAAVELSWLDLGKLEQSLPLYVPFPPAQPQEIRQELRTSGPTLSGLGMLPVGAGFTVYLRAGVLFADMALQSSTPFSDDETAYSSHSFLWGGGVQFDWGDHWSARLDFQRFEDVGEDFEPVQADIDLLNLGIFYRL